MKEIARYRWFLYSLAGRLRWARSLSSPGIVSAEIQIAAAELSTAISKYQIAVANDIDKLREHSPDMLVLAKKWMGK